MCKHADSLAECSRSENRLISFVTWHRAQCDDIRIGMWQAEGRLATAGVKLKHNSTQHTTVSFCLDSLQATGSYYLQIEPVCSYTHT
jgi:hypothetical protein